MTVIDLMVRAYDRLVTPPNQPPDPETASRADIAEWCGIRHPAQIEEWRIPHREYRDGGLVTSDRSGQQPDPPWIVVARYAVDGERTTLTHREYAEHVADRHDLAPGAAEALALHRAGWTARDLEEEWQPEHAHAANASDLLETAKEATR